MGNATFYANVVTDYIVKKLKILFHSFDAVGTSYLPSA